MKQMLECVLTVLAVCIIAVTRVGAAPAAHVPPAPTLASDLQALPPGAVASGTVLLTVAPAAVKPAPLPQTDAPAPATTPALPPLANLADVVARYGRTERTFGRVLAVAPPAMTVLNTNPNLAALPLGTLAGQHPETYLLGSLTPEQLHQVAGDGLSYADMTPDQQSLMRALLPEPLEIVPASAEPPSLALDNDERRAKFADFNAQIQKRSGEQLYGAGLRLHAYLTTQFYVHAPTGGAIGDTRDLSDTTGAFKLPFGGYRVSEAQGHSTKTALRAEVPNVPKDGDLDWRRPALHRPLLLQNIKIVNDLVAQASRATGLELYADTRYGAQPVLIVSGNAPVPAAAAGDALQAVALCVCGTWRAVGPAYVLTDDVQGLGARQAFLDEMGQVWSNRLAQAGKDVGAHLHELDWLHALSFAPGDIGALTPAQLGTLGADGNDDNKGTLKWRDLPPDLQTHLRDHFLHYMDDLLVHHAQPDIQMEHDNMKAAGQSVLPTSPVDATVNIRVAVELPGTGSMMLDAYSVQSASKDDDAPAPSAPAAVTLPERLRAVLCAPRTPDEARAAVAALPKMGLNTLYLDIFCNGRTYFPNDALPPVSPAAGQVLQAALDAARPLRIPVYAVVDTLCWRKDGLAAHPLPWPRGFMQDVTISGETPDQAIQRRVAQGRVRAEYNHPQMALATAGTEGWASPLDPAVRQTLPPLLSALAATPGLAGIVFQNTVPPGYADNDRYGDAIGLGYTLPSRLAYLRRVHQDPVDVAGQYDSLSVSAEGIFEDYPVDIPTFPGNGEAAWLAFRARADQSLLASCWQAVRAAAPTLPILRRTQASWQGFEPWTAPAQADAPPVFGANGFGRRPTSRNILIAGFGPFEQAHLDFFTDYVKDAAGTRGSDGDDAHNPPAGGIVIDLVDGGPPTDLPGTLHRLAALLPTTGK